MPYPERYYILSFTSIIFKPPIKINHAITQKMAQVLEK